MKCITKAWDLYEQELRLFLYNKISDTAIAEDLLQDVFVKALAKREDFCELDNTRAWLFKVTKNRLIDYYRTFKGFEEVDEHIPERQEIKEPVVNLSKCLPTALKSLAVDDCDIIQQCDLDNLNQADYALQKGISLSATKSRIKRARVRLKKELHRACKIILDDHGNVCCFDEKCR